MRLPDQANTAVRAAAAFPHRVAAGLAALAQFLRGDDCPPRDGGVLVAIGTAVVWVALLGMGLGR